MDENVDSEAFFELSALILSLHRKNFELLFSLKSFDAMLSKLTLEKIDNLDSLYNLQHSIIKYFMLHRTTASTQHLHDSFTYLHNEGLLDKLSLEKLISLFDPSLFNVESETQATPFIHKNFNADKQEILMSIHELKKVVNNTKNLENIINYLNMQTFSIGITGVMNAGKSTMLNALMGKNILGISVVPETANLTIVKYNQEPSADVVYWDSSQWQYIERSAKDIKSIEKFVKETKEYFKENFSDYILPLSRRDSIDIDSLSEYTSASSNNKKCNLVQYVELGVPLEFLKDGVEIVDTPGLDDVVIQREEITKEYISKCDVMVHLMNVSQATTIKDIEFIIDAVIYQNVTKVLIVITRVDMVNKKDVEEVIEYTKQSIAHKLHEQNSSAKLDFILKTLHFIPLSGKMALLHRTGQTKEAEKQGYCLADTGILEIESYIQETLFGEENSRSTLIIHSAKNRLLKAMQTEIKGFQYESTLLLKTEDEIDKELSSFKINKMKQLGILELLKEQISGYEVELSNYIDKLQLFLDNELKKLQAILKQRLMDETLYTLQKKKQKPKKSDIIRIIETTLKHGLIDIIRDYRYKFIQKSSKVSETIVLQYDDILSLNEDVHSSFDHTAIFGDSFQKGFVTSNYETLINKIFTLLNGASLSKITLIDEKLSLIIKDEFTDINNQLKNKALSISQELLKEFIGGLKEPLDFFNEKLSNNEKVLQKHLAFLKYDENTRKTKSLELYERIQKIELISQRYSK